MLSSSMTSASPVPLGGERLEVVPQEAPQFAGIQRQVEVEIAQAEVTVREPDLKVAAFEGGTVLVAKHGQQHLLLQGALDRHPVDVEETGERR